jgi:hypothetical protein
LQFACVVFIRINKNKNKNKNGNKNSSGYEEDEEISGNRKKIDWFDLTVPIGPRWVALPSSHPLSLEAW